MQRTREDLKKKRDNKKDVIQEMKEDIEFLKSLHPKEYADYEKSKTDHLERLKKEEAERKAKEEAERKAKEEERLAKEEEERKAKEEAERKAKEQAERKAKEEAERIEEERKNNELRLEMERMEKERKEKEKEIIKHIDNEQKIIKELLNKIDNDEIAKVPPVEAEICGVIEEVEESEVDIMSQKIEQSEEESEEESDATLYEEIETELKDVQPNPTLEKKLLELYGNIEFQEILCNKCEEAKAEYVKKAKEEGITEITANYFSMTCKGCQKARFNSWKCKKKADKEKKVADDKNSDNKTKVKQMNKKIELKNKLDKIDEEYKEGKTDRVIEKLEKINKGQGNLALNIYINKQK